LTLEVWNAIRNSTLYKTDYEIFSRIKSPPFNFSLYDIPPLPSGPNETIRRETFDVEVLPQISPQKNRRKSAIPVDIISSGLPNEQIVQ
jgi:hypothetical protein